MKTTLAICLCGLAVLVAVAGEPKPAEKDGQVGVREVRKKDDKVEVAIREGILFVEVESPSGIGSARLVLESGAWPKKLVVHLKYAPGRPFSRLEGPGAALELAKAEPLKVGVVKPDGFEADIPPTAAKALSVQWIDAYRN